jgi:hypothetical protein
MFQLGAKHWFQNRVQPSSTLIDQVSFLSLVLDLALVFSAYVTPTVLLDGARQVGRIRWSTQKYSVSVSPVSIAGAALAVSDLSGWASNPRRSRWDFIF